MGSDAGASDPFSLPGTDVVRRLAERGGAVALVVLGLFGCASAPSGQEPGPEPEPGAEARPGEESEGEASEVTDMLERLEALRSSRPATAAKMADSAYFRWRARPDRRKAALRLLLLEARALEDAGEPIEAAARLADLLAARDGEAVANVVPRLVRLRMTLGQEPDAVGVLLEYGQALPAEERRELLRRAAQGMAIRELRDALAGGSSLPSADEAVLRAELARALALQGRRAEAREAARKVPREAAGGAELEVVRRVEAGDLGPEESAPPEIEVVLPLSGRLEPVGRSLRRGMEIALEAHREARADSVTVHFRDDESSQERSRELVRRAERTGAVAVVGPVRSAAFRGAMEERADRALLLVSPTASEVPRSGWNAYGLWDLESRERALAGAMGRWLVESAGLRSLAVLRPRGSGGRSVEQAFRGEVRRAGGAVVAGSSYEPDSTTFESAVRLLAGHEPEGIYVASRDPRTTLQLAPQLSYYGLPDVAVAGGSGWGTPAVVRRLRGESPSRYVTAVFMDRGDGTPWAGFRAMYETKYDKQLSESELPALGYDALRVALDASSSVGLPRRGAVARAAAGEAVEGATGSFRLQPGRPAAIREPVVRVGTDGRLVPAEPAAVAGWRRNAEERARGQESRRRELAAERVRQWSGESGGGP